MRIGFMRALDRFVGIPLCWIAGMWMKLFPPAPRTVERILVIKFFGMGSIVLATPALQALRAAFPQARITFLTFRANRQLVERLGMIDEVFSIDPHSLASLVEQTIGIMRVLHKGAFDVVFDFEFFSKFSTLLAAWTRAPRRIGFALPTRWRTMLVTDHVPLTKERHVMHAFLAQVERIAPVANAPLPANPIVTADDLRALDVLVPRDGTRDVIINVNAGTTFLERRWPAERFIALVDALAQRDDSTYYFIGTAAERAYTQDVIDHVAHPERCVNIAGMLTVPHVTALVGRAALVISNDTGPLHLAAVSGTPTVALYGPESPAFYGPRGPRVEIVYAAAPCSPCMNIYDAKSFHCPYDARCMRDIAVADVVRAIDRALAQ